ncbi:hypothetical protein TcasGA2_TC034541 [Tribolium castaneum]|uniref:VWFC domain-containing protein n=1 Tax=Tribolium castaneum TaxID=7070 RepID=A0A139WNL5_TRICA|nr:hypothetical protein TcasGA2_TC034541 [Tribolium castaneum]
MKLFVILFLQSFFIYLTIGTPVTGDSSCDVYGTLIYEDFGCTPEHDNASKCPSRFSCKGLEPSKDQCYFRGRAYQNREEVNTSLLLPSCESSCFCQTNENRARFTCAITECAEELGRPFKKGCYGKYTLDSCCSVGEVCQDGVVYNFDLVESTVKILAPHSTVWIRIHNRIRFCVVPMAGFVLMVPKLLRVKRSQNTRVNLEIK